MIRAAKSARLVRARVIASAAESGSPAVKTSPMWCRLMNSATVLTSLTTTGSPACRYSGSLVGSDISWLGLRRNGMMPRSAEAR